MVQKVFNRYEKKYLLDRDTYLKMREALEPYMTEDEYGLHNIRNIYYDTDDYELIRTSIEKPKYKEKFRIRCYGQPDENSNYFLEIKKKYNGLVNKRRMVLKQGKAVEFLSSPDKRNGEDQITREISYFLQHYPIKPKLYLAYDRIALFGKEDKSFRITFDQNIRSRDHDLDLRNDQDTTPLLEEGQYLMEVKIGESMPLWFVEILSKLKVFSVSFSKYGNIYKNSVTTQVTASEYQKTARQEVPNYHTGKVLTKAAFR